MLGVVHYNYRSKHGNEEQLQHRPNSLQYEKVLFGHWIVNGGSFAVRYVSTFSEKLQVWVSDSAHIDLNEKPTIEEYFIGTGKIADLATKNDNKIVVRLEKIGGTLTTYYLKVFFNGIEIDDANTPLHLACANDDVSDVEQLIDIGEKINARNNKGRTPLLEAIRCGQDDSVVRLLIANGADVNVYDVFSETPLHWACANDRVGVAMMLFEKGANVNAKNNKGRTPLHCAGFLGRNEWFKLLISKGADVYARDYNGKTPLGESIEEGSLSLSGVVFYNYKTTQHKKEQLKHSPKSWQTNSTGSYPILFGHWIVNGGSIAVRYIQASNEKLQVWVSDSAHIDLKEKPIFKKESILSIITKADIKGKNGYTIAVRLETNEHSPRLKVYFNGRKIDDGYTPLHLACANDDVSDVEQQLIEIGEKINARNNKGRTPLLEAIRCGHDDDVVRLLIANGADVNVYDVFSETPLHWACANDRVGVAMMLFEKGADVNAKNNKGRTPLHCAGFLGRNEWFKLLISKGADVYAQDCNGKTPLQLALNLGDSVALEELEALKDLEANGTTGKLAKELAQKAAMGAAWGAGETVGEVVGESLIALFVFL